MPQLLTVEILIEDPAWSKKRLGLQKFSEETLLSAWKQVKGKSKTRPYVSIVFTDDKRVKKLNRQFRDKNRPTNVLSFQTWPDVPSIPAGDVPVGDIVFAFETVQKEALEKKISFKDHLSHLMIHGFLHLCGYDHLDDDQAAAMEGLEIKILKKMGIQNPY